MILAIYLFFLIYAPRIGRWIDINGILSFYLVLRALLVGGIEPPAVRRLRLGLLALFLCLIGYWFLIHIATGHQDNYFLFRFLRIIVQFMGVYALVRVYYRKYYQDMASRFMLHLYYVIGAHAVIMLIMYTIPPVRDFVYSVTQVDVEMLQGDWARTGARTGGLLTALDTLSAVQAFGIIIYLLILPMLRGVRLLICNLLLFIIIFSVLVSGRTGFLILILLSPLLLYHIKREVFRMIPKVLVGMVLLIILIMAVTPSAELQERIDWQIERLKKVFPSEETAGSELESGAVGKLIDDWLHNWPDDPVVLLFGNSRSARRPDYMISADPGYILDTYGIGIIGMSMISLFYIICLIHAKKCMPLYKKFALASLLYTLVVLIVNAKVRFAMAREGFTPSVALMLITVYQQHFGVAYDETEYGVLPEQLDEGLMEYEQMPYYYE